MTLLPDPSRHCFEAGHNNMADSMAPAAEAVHNMAAEAGHNIAVDRGYSPAGVGCHIVWLPEAGGCIGCKPTRRQNFEFRNTDKTSYFLLINF